jgi:hypothetical protein
MRTPDVMAYPFHPLYRIDSASCTLEMPGGRREEIWAQHHGGLNGARHEYRHRVDSAKQWILFFDALQKTKK